MHGRDWLLLTTLALLWAVSFFLVEIALSSIGPLTIAASRITLAAAALFIWAAIKGALGKSGGSIANALKNRWRAYLAMGAFNNAIPFTCFAWGQQYIDSGLAAVMNAATPLATVLLAFAVGEEKKIPAPRMAGVIAGLAGVAALVGPVFGDDLNAGLGALAALGAAVSYAIAALLGRRRLSDAAPPLENAVCMLAASALMLAPLSLALEAPWRMSPDTSALLAAAVLAFGSTALAYLVYFRLLASVGATNTTLVTFLIPPITIVLGAVFLDEKFGVDFFAGAGLIFIGLILIDAKLRAAAYSFFPGKK
jgi:drug/metabolite transporter (DMT)-like permease